MKKILLSLVAFAMSVAAVSAQEAFKHLSLGVEAGTTGAGVELSFPLVTNHVIVKAGYNFPSYSYEIKADVPMSDINAQIADVNAELSAKQVPERINTTFSDAELTLNPSINFGAAKLMFELYPFKKSSFHLTVGAYMGMAEDFVSLGVQTDKQFWSDYNSFKGEVAALDAKYGGIGSIEDPKFSVGKTTYQIKEKAGMGALDASIAVAKLRPYVGIGFGRSIPDSRLGLQLDFGIWSHGAPTLNSGNIVNYDADAVQLLDEINLEGFELPAFEDLVFYPQASIRIVYKIF